MCFVIWKKSNKIWKRKIYDKREKKKKKEKLTPFPLNYFRLFSIYRWTRDIDPSLKSRGIATRMAKRFFFFLNRSIEKTRRKKPRCSVSNNRIESSRAIYDAVYFRKCSHSALKKRRNVASSRCFSSFYCF